MDPRMFVDDSRNLLELSRAEETGAGRWLLAANTRKEAMIVNEVVNHPVNSDKIDETVAYKLGMIRGLRFGRELVEAAKKFIKKAEEGEGK